MYQADNSLAKMIETKTPIGDDITYIESAKKMLHFCNVLDKEGITYKDIKPDNMVYISNEKRIRYIDVSHDVYVHTLGYDGGCGQQSARSLVEAYASKRLRAYEDHNGAARVTSDYAQYASQYYCDKIGANNCDAINNYNDLYKVIPIEKKKDLLISLSRNNRNYLEDFVYYTNMIYPQIQILTGPVQWGGFFAQQNSIGQQFCQDLFFNDRQIFDNDYINNNLNIYCDINNGTTSNFKNNFYTDQNDINFQNWLINLYDYIIKKHLKKPIFLSQDQKVLYKYIIEKLLYNASITLRDSILLLYDLPN